MVPPPSRWLFRRDEESQYHNDKVAKDDNFRGVTVESTVVYYTKGSGSNGVNTVYYVNTSGTSCSPTTSAAGLPQPGASLPDSSAFSYTPTAGPRITKHTVTTNNPGLKPENMCILSGFPAVSARRTTAMHPFGMWFANPDTLYVADEGNGANTNATANTTSNGLYTAAAAQTKAGLQKWVFTKGTQAWKYQYTLQAGLNLGQPYTVPGYPTGINRKPVSKTRTKTTHPWAPATDGLRNLTGRVNPNGTVSIWATTSTVSGSGDQGADPNSLVEVTDQLGATTLPSNETFHTVVAPHDATVVRGVSFTPGTQTCQQGPGPLDNGRCLPVPPGPHGPQGPFGSDTGAWTGNGYGYGVKES